MRRLFAVAACSLLCGAVQAQEVRVPVIADVWVCAHRSQKHDNVGAGKQLKLKGIQEMSLLRFDVSALRGRRIRGGQLHLRESGERNRLRKIGLSTVSSRWVEGKAKTYARDTAGHGATFMEASYQRRPWAYPGSCLSDVTMGNGNTLQHHTELVRLDERWIRVDVPDYLIQALVAGASDGLLVMDESGQMRANNYVYSRESGDSAPYLIVRVDGRAEAAPAAPRVRVRPDPGRASLDSGAADLLIAPPDGAFAYEVEINGKPLDRWRIPFPPGIGEPVVIATYRVPPAAVMENGRQKVVIADLDPGQELRVRVRAISAGGIAGPWASATGRASDALPRPERLRPVKLDQPAADPPVHADRMRVWAFPDTVKIDPTDGAGRWRRSNPVWSGKRGAVLLSAARGEIVGFQLCVEATRGTLENVRVVPSSLQPEDAAGATPIDRRHIRLFAVWYVKSGRRWYGEYAIPIDRGRGLDVPWPKNKVPAQRNQAFFLDVLVPKRTPPGRYRGRLSVSARGVNPVALPVELRVHAFTLPDELNFYGDLNSYRTPGRAGSKRFSESHRLAHAHRCTIVTVPYKHRGTVDPHVVPPVAGRGDDQRVKDWTEFDRNCGPLFDGSMFKGCPRGGVPVNYFYLPFHENWPNPIAEHWDARVAVLGSAVDRPACRAVVSAMRGKAIVIPAAGHGRDHVGVHRAAVLVGDGDDGAAVGVGQAVRFAEPLRAGPAGGP
ncbi:MAG: DNRLRE domain-containing protein, partial [Planctomycetota bacterium]